jgi:hypothetical protein
MWIGEVLYHGWGGLNWISYFHYSIPVSIVLVMLWVIVFAANTAQKRLGLCLLLPLFSVAGFIAYERALIWHFIAGPVALPYFLYDPLYRFKRWLIIPLLIGTPIIFHALISVPSALLTRKSILSTLLFWISPLIGYVVMYAFTKYDDAIHIIKTGSAIPFLIISLCYPYIVNGAQQGDAPEPASPGR